MRSSGTYLLPPRKNLKMKEEVKQQRAKCRGRGQGQNKRAKTRARARAGARAKPQTNILCTAVAVLFNDYEMVVVDE